MQDFEDYGEEKGGVLERSKKEAEKETNHVNHKGYYIGDCRSCPDAFYVWRRNAGTHVVWL